MSALGGGALFLLGGGGALTAVLSRRGRRPKQLVLVFSGKRKSGKDYTTDRLLEVLEADGAGAAAEIGRLSAPLKKAYVAYAAAATTTSSTTTPATLLLSRPPRPYRTTTTTTTTTTK